MIPRRMHSMGLRAQITVPFQWLNITIRLSSNSSSSSDSSSDSDSDSEKKNQTKQPIVEKMHEPKEKGSDLDALLQNMLNSAPTTQRFDIALKPRIKKSKKPLEEQPYVYRLKAAANKVASKLGGDKESVVSQLLEKVEIRQPRKDIPPMHINNVVPNIMQNREQKIDRIKKPWAQKSSIIHDLVAMERTKHSRESIDDEARTRSRDKIMSTEGMQLCPNIAERASNIPDLNIWKTLEKKELDLLVSHSPQNIFQELIQWTEQGKLWKFPIDNEQGMDQEHSVHFSKHVFMERHLKDWCPKQGPVRQFMELVCVGLSKNPYLTVEEKLSHIAWYKEFFEDKKDLLKELGAIETPLSDSTKQIES